MRRAAARRRPSSSRSRPSWSSLSSTLLLRSSSERHRPPPSWREGRLDAIHVTVIAAHPGVRQAVAGTVRAVGVEPTKIRQVHGVAASRGPFAARVLAVRFHAHPPPCPPLRGRTVRRRQRFRSDARLLRSRQSCPAGQRPERPRRGTRSSRQPTASGCPSCGTLSPGRRTAGSCASSVAGTNAR